MIRNLEILESKDLKLKSTSIHDLAIRLIEGGIVQYDGQFVKAIEALDPDAPCLECTMYSACSLQLMELCAAVDGISNIGHCLALASDNH